MKIPKEIIADAENELDNLAHGFVDIRLHLRDYRISHYKINREKSVVTLAKNEKDVKHG